MYDQQATDRSTSQRLLIFDCDGVLIDSETIALEVLSTMMAGYGHPMSLAACQDAFMGMHTEDIVRAIGELIGRSLPADEGRRMREQMMERMAQELKPVPGIAEELAKLDGPRCVASSSDPSRIRQTLKWTNLDGFFGDAIFSGFDVPNGKPAPDLFLYAADAMGFTPAACIVIEDSPAGVQAGVAAGMRTIGFVGASHTNAGHRARLETAGAQTVISTMTELPDALARVDAA